jgi:hypothetical protein
MIVEDPDLIGVVAKLTGRIFEMIVNARYEDVAARLIGALGQVRHVCFVHETVLAGVADAGTSSESDESDEDDALFIDFGGYFTPPSYDQSASIRVC